MATWQEVINQIRAEPNQFDAVRTRYVNELFEYRSRNCFVKGDIGSAEAESLWRWKDLEESKPHERARTLKAAAEVAYNQYNDGGDLTGFDADDELSEY